MLLVLAFAAAHVMPSCGALIKGAVPETDVRLRALFSEIAAASGTTASVMLCTMDDVRGKPKAGSGRPTESPDVYNVYLSSSFRTLVTDREVRGVLAHEFAHIVRGDVPDSPFWHVQTFREYLEREMAADRLAAGWVGDGAVVAALRKMYFLASAAGVLRPGDNLELTYRVLALNGW